MEQLEGVVKHIIFASNDGKFCVFRLKNDKLGHNTVVTMGSQAPLMDQHLSLEGEWVEHPKFGHQFKAYRVMISQHNSLEDIVRFLSSGAIKGIKATMAQRIVDTFGFDTMEILDNNPKQLLQVPGLGAKTLKKIIESYKDTAELRQIMMWLEAHNVSGMLAGKIKEKYGSFAVEVMEANPYRLAREVNGIGFITADTIAASLGIEKTDDARITGGLEYQMEQISSNGHCCVPDQYIIEKTVDFLGVPAELVRDVLEDDIQKEIFIQETVGDVSLVYPRGLYWAEVNVARYLLRLKKKAEYLDVFNASRLVSRWEAKSGIKLAEQQRQAVESVLEYGIFVLTGGPGTGKTTVIRGMIDILEQQGLEILLGAPTGRAAKRLAETTGRSASTVHRLLEANGGQNENGSMFDRNKDDQLEADVVILDEVSMMDITLMNHFLEAVPEGAHVIMVGDVDQLPAVGPGSVLKDILRSGVIPQVRLMDVFRQSGTSSIVLNAHAINAGRMPNIKKADDKQIIGANVNVASEPNMAGCDVVDDDYEYGEIPDFYSDPRAFPGEVLQTERVNLLPTELEDGFSFIENNDAQVVESLLVAMCQQYFPQHDYDPLVDVQVLSPMHKGCCGVDRLNELLQEALNPLEGYKQEKKLGGHILREGDKVMQTRNNYEKHVFNGDTGIISRVDGDTVTVVFADDQEVDYKGGEANELQLAYCISVHKSQGSEYPVVIMPLIPAHHIMLQRNLLYTAVTRAKQQVVILGSRAALETAVSNDRTRRRYTLLAERLCQVL